MRRRLFVVIAFGLIGVAILISLGIWQLNRLAWKESVLAEIEARIGSAPVPVPAITDPVDDRYLPVSTNGTLQGEPVRILVSVQGSGPGYRLISVIEAEGRRLMVDRGFIAESAGDAPEPTGPITVIGNLHWPDEIDGFTPSPDVARNIWYARDVAALANHLGTEPILIVAREPITDGPVTPLPVTSEGIPNNHLGYAVQWFGLALVWLGMTAFLGWRITRRTA